MSYGSGGENHRKSPRALLLRSHPPLGNTRYSRRKGRKVIEWLGITTGVSPVSSVRPFPSWILRPIPGNPDRVQRALENIQNEASLCSYRTLNSGDGGWDQKEGFLQRQGVRSGWVGRGQRRDQSVRRSYTPGPSPLDSSYPARKAFPVLSDWK